MVSHASSVVYICWVLAMDTWYFVILLCIASNMVGIGYAIASRSD